MALFVEQALFTEQTNNFIDKNEFNRREVLKQKSIETLRNIDSDFFSKRNMVYHYIYLDDYCKYFGLNDLLNVRIAKITKNKRLGNRSIV